MAYAMKLFDALFEGADGVWSGGTAHILLIISIVIALGKILGSIKISGVSFGVTWVLFTGILFGHLGLTIDINLLHFMKEFGLVLFIYSIGLQVGPGFFASFRSGGIMLNMLAIIVVFSGIAVTVLLFSLTEMPITTLVGIMSGAVTNTPGFGAAQQAFTDISGQSAPDIALGYAVAYPLGVIGCIMTFIIIRKLLYRTPPAVVPETSRPNHDISKISNPTKCNDHPHLIPIFMGIALGCILGSIPIHIPCVQQPIKLGLAGGPLIVSILISYLGPKIRITTYTTLSANLMLREIGISIFLACIGLEAGENFIDTLVEGCGLVWIAYGALITVIPILIGGLIGRYIMKIGYSTLTGVLAGSCTNPPALAYCEEQETDTENCDIGYATVYPLTMFLRIIAAQMLIVIIS